MRLKKLMERVNATTEFEDMEVSAVTDKFDNIQENSVFVCIKGKKVDGHMFASEAITKGACCVIAERDTGEKKQIIVDDARKAYALMCSAMYSNPADEIKMIGVTGTNGKTSTAYYIRQLLEFAGHKTGLIGTVFEIVGDKTYDSNLTTPEPAQLFKMLREMADNACEYCVMEVSSQALEQQRVEGITFETAVFTNLTVDHLDYHKTMEEYKKAKKKLFANSKKAVLNFDDTNSDYMCDGIDIKKTTYSIKDDRSDYTAKNVELFEDHIKYELVGTGVIGRVKLNVPGRFTVYNSMAAAVTVIEQGIGTPVISKAFMSMDGVKGRMETVETGKDYTVIIDYAHTPDGLENLLKSLREVYIGRIITVFGCGGDRDKTKRPQMGSIAGELSDIVVVTSDNPRSEDPELIIKDILGGMEKTKARKYTISDRTKAIKKAISLARTGDVVVLAGKGHETYQILSTGKIHYDEREIINEILTEK